MAGQYHHFRILRRQNGGLWELERSHAGGTYRAHDTRKHSDVVLRVIFDLRDAEARRQFFSEVQIAAQLRSPHLATIFYSGEQDGECFYAMELIEGQSLEEHVRQRGKFSMRQALQITLQIASALDVIERAGLIHGNVSPRNIVLTKNENGRLTAKLMSFGRHHLREPSHSMSPEELQGERPDIRSDVYSLGATLYFMITAEQPLVSATAHVLATQLQYLPSEIGTLLLQMLARDPVWRPQTASDLQTRVEACLRSPEIASMPSVLPPPLPHAAHRHSSRVITFLIGAGMIALLGFAGIFLIFLVPLVAKTSNDRVPPSSNARIADPPQRSSTVSDSETIKHLLANAAALQAQERYAEALNAYARIAERFPEQKTPLSRMEMIAALLRSNAFLMTPAKFSALRAPLEAAAARNVVSAQVLLGEQLRNSDPSEALKWFKAAAENGQTEAMTQAGLMLANGSGTSTADLQRAIKWFEQAADAGNSDAMTALAECLLDGKGMKQDPKRAAELLHTATVFNHPGALNRLGDLYTRGLGVKQDFSEALRLFTRASKLGSGEATANLGVLYMRGQGVPANPRKAVAIWKSGAERGFSACMLNYAKALESGTGIAPNPSEAKQWYLKAARAGNPNAQDWCRRQGLSP